MSLIRRGFCVATCVFAFLLAGFASAAGAQQDALRMLAGAAAVDITPTGFPVIINGSFTEHSADVAHDRLMSRAVVLDDGEMRLAIVVVDSLMIERELLDQVKERAHRETGIPVDRMLISATHTHSAPSCMGCLGSRADPVYTRVLPGLIARSISEANARVVPARIGWTVVADHDHNHCRRWILRPDRIGNDPFGEANVRANMHPGHLSENHIGPSGPADPDLSILAIQHADGRPMAVLGNYAMHYFGTAAVSGDFCGRFGERFAALAGIDAAEGFVGVMSQGTSGDSMWMDYSKPATGITLDQYTEAVARVAVRAYESIEYRDHVPLGMAEAKLSLRRRVADEARLAWARRIDTELGDRLPGTMHEIYAREQVLIHARPEVELKLQAVRIGELGITALPNEVYGITGLKIKAQSPFRPTFNIELANGAEGYIPPVEQHHLGGYTTWAARTAGLEVPAEAKIVETVLGLLESVSGRSRRPMEDPLNDYAKAVLASKPAGMWRLGEMNGATAHDAAGDRHGEYEPGVAFYLPGPDGAGLSAGPRGNRAAHFAGGRVRAKVRSPGDRHTVTFWFWSGMPDDVRDVTGYLYSLGGTEGGSEEWLAIGGTGGAAFGRLVFGVGDGPEKALVGRAEIQPRTWNHIAVVRDGERVNVYLNGAEKPEISGHLPPIAAAGVREVFIGGRRDGVAGLEGKLDEFAIFDRALPLRELTDHFVAARFTPPPATPSSSATRIKPSAPADLESYAVAIAASKPRAWWTLHEADGAQAPDRSGGGNVGVLEEGATITVPGEGALNFTGGRMTCAIDSLGEAYSVELWFWNSLSNDTRPVTGYFFSRGVDGAAGAPGDHLGIGGTHGGAGRLIVFNGNDRGQLLIGRTHLRPRTWNHVLLVREGGKMRAYLNGQTQPDLEGEMDMTWPRAGGRLFIGGRNDHFANFRGIIDQVAVYDRVLTPAEFEEHHRASGAEASGTRKAQ